MVVILLTALCILCLSRFGHACIQKAVATMTYNSSINGTITFYQENGLGPVNITILLSGVEPRSARGLHIHELGDFSRGCSSVGRHYNPFNKPHGDFQCGEHHLGDLGNVPSDSSGSVNFTLVSKELSLNGDYSIVGRAIALHAGTDDLGLGGQNDSLINGHSGPIAACGGIGVAG